MKYKTQLIFVIVIFISSFLTAQTLTVDIKVFLEGPYISSDMNSTLDLSSQLTHPYSSIHSGTESVAAGFFSSHTNIVDWILLELRDKDDNTQVIKKRAAFLLDDGHIVDLDGVSPVSFNVVDNDYYVSVQHRNHLSVLSSTIAYRNTCLGVPTITYAGKTYNTVQIGNQCWLRENINVGGRINSKDVSNNPQNQTNNSIIEKYCYDDNEANCTQYGGLYQWAEVVQYENGATNTSNTTPALSGNIQGICPNGWHIPTFAEFQTLKAAVSNNSNALKLIGQGSGNGAGNNSSGFSALLTGEFFYNDGNYFSKGFSAFIWSTNENGRDATAMDLDFGNNFISLFTTDKRYGYSVRCLKD